MADQPDDKRSEQARENGPDDALLQSIIKPKCDLCGSLMLEVHCRMMCPMCGYQRDCSDP
ncbi:MAG: HVO_2523 family zinc finger protein [Gemmatimonadota bacterium]